MKWLGIAVSLGLLGAAFMPSVQADEWSKASRFQFKEAVEVPGMTLQPGQYVFRLWESQSNRNLVQIFNADQKHLYTTVEAIPRYHLVPRNKTELTFTERAAGAPPAIKLWFYPGDNYGQEFVYSTAPSLAPKTMAEVSRQPMAPPPAPVAAAPQPAPAPEKPTQIAQAAPPPPAPAPAPAAPAPVKPLPKTGSSLPLFGLAGLGLLASAAALRLARRLLG